jgi:hypothetical protein
MGGPGVEVEVLPSEPEHLGHPPTLYEQQPHRRTQPVVSHRCQQRPGLGPIECRAV